MSHNPTANDWPGIDWDAIVDDDPIVAEVRRIRAELAAEFGGDVERQDAAHRLKNWAAGLDGSSADNPPELPADLSWLIPDSEEFIQIVLVHRSVKGKRAPDLAAYNEDGRRRARLLGFPEESFVVSPKDFPPDVDYSSPDWLKQLWPDEEVEPVGESGSESINGSTKL